MSGIRTKIPSASKKWVEDYVSANGGGGTSYIGGYDASVNSPDLDTSPSGVSKGDMYTVTVSGNFFTVLVEVGDVIISEKDDPALESDWTILNKNLTDVFTNGGEIAGSTRTLGNVDEQDLSLKTNDVVRLTVKKDGGVEIDDTSADANSTVLFLNGNNLYGNNDIEIGSIGGSPAIWFTGASGKRFRMNGENLEFASISSINGAVDFIGRKDLNFKYYDGSTYHTCLYSDLVNSNFGINTTDQFGNGKGVIGIAEAEVAPSSNPTDGSILYVDPADGKTKILSSDGSLIVLENAEIEQIGTPTYQTIQDWFNATQSAGIIEGGSITDDGDGTVTITAGKGIIKTSNSETATGKFFDFSENTSLSLIDNSTNFIAVDYNAGTPQIISSTINTSNGRTIFNLGKLYKEGTTIDIIDAGLHVADLAKRIQHHHIEKDVLDFTSGAVVGETGTRNITVSSGVMYAGLNRLITEAVDTSGADDFELYYYDGSAWQESDATQIDNLQYNDITSGLSTLANNQYGIFWVFKGTGSSVFVLYGQGSYSLVEAQTSNVPAILPPHISGFSALRAKIIIKKSATSFTEIENTSNGSFQAQSASDHSELANLQGGTTDEYYHLTATEYSDLSTDGSTLDEVKTRSRKNLLINGGFDVWQRGTSFTGLTSGQYVSDMHYVSPEGSSTIDIAKQSNVYVDGLGNVNTCKMTFTTPPATILGTDLGYKLEPEEMRKYIGKTLNLSFYVRASESMDAQVAQYYSTGITEQNHVYSITTSWQRISCQLTLSSSTTFTAAFWFLQYLRINTVGMSVNSWVEVAGVQMEVGDIATDFEPTSYGEELTKCRRYFQVIEGAPGTAASATTAQIIVEHYGMRVQPTVSASAPLKVTNCYASDFTQSSESLAISDGTSSFSRIQVLALSGMVIGDSAHLISSGGKLLLSAEI